MRPIFDVGKPCGQAMRASHAGKLAWARFGQDVGKTGKLASSNMGSLGRHLWQEGHDPDVVELVSFLS